MLRHCSTSWKVAGSIPGGTIGIFHWHNPSRCTLALGWTQSNRNEYQELFLGVKAALPPSCADCLEIWEPLSPGTLGSCPGLYRGCLKDWFKTSSGRNLCFCALKIRLQLSHDITASKYSPSDGLYLTCFCGSRIICYCSLCNWIFGNKYLRSHTKKGNKWRVTPQSAVRTCSVCWRGETSTFPFS